MKLYIHVSYHILHLPSKTETTNASYLVTGQQRSALETLANSCPGKTASFKCNKGEYNMRQENVYKIIQIQTLTEYLDRSE